MFPIVKINIDEKVPNEVCISKGYITLISDTPGVDWIVNGIKQDSIFDISKAIIGENIIIARDIIGCTTPDTLKIKVVDDKVKIKVLSPICPNAAPISLSTLPNNKGTWTGKGIDAITGIFSPKIAGAGTHQINYSYKIPNTACVAKDSVKIEVIALDMSFKLDKCEGVNITFDLLKNSKVDSVLWLFGDGQKSTQNTATVTHTYPSAGTYIVTLKGFLGECDTTLTDTITVEEKAIAKFEMDSVLCENQILTIEDISKGTNLKYKWFVGNVVVGTTLNFPSNIKFNVNQDSIVIVKLEVTNGCGTDIISKPLKIKAKPLANFGSILQEYCSGAEFYIQNTSSGATDFKWYLDGVLISSQAQLDSLVLLTGKKSTTYTFTLVASNYCGSDSISKNFIIKPTDVKASFTINKKTFCVGENLTVTSNATQNAVVQYALGNGTLINQSNFKFAYQDSGKYKIVQYVYGCGFDSTFVEITVLALPKVEVVAKANCWKLPTEVITKPNGNSVIHQLEKGDTSSSAKFNYWYKNPGIYSIKTTATSQNGCKSTLNTPVEIYDLPNAYFTIDSVACKNAPVVLSTDTKNGVIFHSGDGNISDSKTTIFKYENGGLYNPYVIFTDNNTCKDTLKKSVFINPTPEAGFEIPTATICPPVDLPITDSSTGATKFEYSTDNGLKSNAKSPSFKFPQGGDFTITQIVSNQTCSDTLTKPFKIKTVPIIKAEAVSLTCNKSNDGRIIVTPYLKTDMITIINKSIKYQQTGISSFEKLKPGTYNIIATSLDGCSAFDSIKVVEPEPITLSISNRDTIYLSSGGIDTLDVVTNIFGVNFIWDSTVGFKEITITKNNRTIVIAPPSDILYHLTVVDSTGCKATSKVYVLIDKKYKIFLPNTFSPNGDNINDNFTIFADIKVVQKVEIFKVFDRWGNEVFSNENFQPNIEAEGWNGTFRNEPAPLGVYIYSAKVLFKDGTTHGFKGDVELVR